MKKKGIILIISILSPLFWRGVGGEAFAQNTDSLFKVYNDKTQADTNRLNAMQVIASSLSGNNPDTAIMLAEQEVKLANSLQDEKGKKWVAKAFNTIGIAFNNKGNYPKAIEYYLKTLKLKEEIGDKRGIGACYGNIGIVYKNQSNYPKALEYLLKTLKIMEEIKNKQGEGLCYNNIGIVYKEEFNYPKHYLLLNLLSFF
jgi:tetratricopeptide (TPR) repeat protein